MHSLNSFLITMRMEISLKFTAQKYLLGIGSWDNAFEGFLGLFWKLFANNTPENYQKSEEWKKVVD